MKKLYKNTLMQLIVALCTFSFVACQEFDIDSQPEGPLNIQIDAQDSYTAYAVSPSNIVFNISANTPWTIESDQQWCKPTPAMSAASSLVSEIVVSLEDNPGDTRTATLTIKAEGINQTKVITIEQSSKEKLELPEITEMIPTEGNTAFTFKLYSNKAWELIPSVDFLSDIDKTSGAGKEEWETITINVPSNPGAKREGSITVRTEFEEKTINITQNGVVIEIADEGGTTINMNGTSQKTNYSEKTVEISANKEWEVEVPKEFQEWISAEKISETELKVRTMTNPLMTSRKGTILMKTKEIIPGFEGVSFDIIQGVAFWKDGNADNFILNEETGTLTVTGNASAVVSNFLFKKGKLTLEFESINLTETDYIEFNSWTDYGTQPNFHLWLCANTESNFTCGGGLNWTQQKFTWSTEQVNAAKKIELIVDYKEGNSDYLILKAIIDGTVVATLDNNIMDCYATGDDSKYPGQTLHVRLHGNGCYTVKSIDWEPAE